MKILNDNQASRAIGLPDCRLGVYKMRIIISCVIIRLLEINDNEEMQI